MSATRNDVCSTCLLVQCLHVSLMCLACYGPSNTPARTCTACIAANHNTHMTYAVSCRLLRNTPPVLTWLQAAALQSAPSRPIPVLAMRTDSAHVGIGAPPREASGADASTSGSDGGSDDRPAAADHAGVKQLLSLCDDAVSAEFLAHLLLQQCLGDVEVGGVPWRKAVAYTPVWG